MNYVIEQNRVNAMKYKEKQKETKKNKDEEYCG